MIQINYNGMGEKKFFDKKNVLVLGGAGFIGSHLCDDLVKNSNVICVDNFVSGNPKNIEHLLLLPNFVLLKMDINELTDLEKIPEVERFDIKFQGIQEIYNLAVPTSPKNFNKFKVETAVTNSQGTINALNLAVKHRSKFLQFSSSVIYGNGAGRDQFLKETDYHVIDPLANNAVYDEGKKFAETLCFSYKEKFDLDVKIVRIFRTYGPRMPLFEGHMIPDFIVAAIDNQPLVLYGGPDFTTSLIYVDDVIDACHKIMNSVESGPFNVGSPFGYKLADVANKIIEIAHSTSVVEFAPTLQFMRELGLPDITMAKSKIDWFPVTTLETGIKKTMEYTQAHKILVDWNQVKKIGE